MQITEPPEKAPLQYLWYTQADALTTRLTGLSFYKDMNPVITVAELNRLSEF